ncbi:MAG: hypothetical protein ABIO71_10155, partial [Caldimonas sp.]
MDFRHLIAAPAALAAIDVDALILVLSSEVDPSLAPALAGLIDGAIAEGELTLKKGKSLYCYRPAGVAARRVAVVFA